MSTVTFSLVTQEDGSATITAFINGVPFTADSQHPSFAEIREALLESSEFPAWDWDASTWDDNKTDDEYLRDLFDVSITVGQTFERLSDRVSVSNGRVYFDGEEIDNALTEQILRFKAEGNDEDMLALVNFFEKVSTNPSEHSREHLYIWVRRHNVTITRDGDLVGYKGLRAGHLSGNAGIAIVDGVVVKGQIPNFPGSVISMPRNQVVFDPNNGCASGLHFSTFDFAKSYRSHDGYIVSLAINPRDVVSVPNGADKVRAAQYKVIEDVEGPYEGLVYGDAEDDEDYDDEWETAWSEDDADEYYDNVEKVTQSLFAAFGPHEWKTQRKAKGYSQRKLSKISGVAKSYIGQIENGDRTPSQEVADKLAAALQ